PAGGGEPIRFPAAGVPPGRPCGPAPPGRTARACRAVPYPDAWAAAVDGGVDAVQGFLRRNRAASTAPAMVTRCACPARMPSSTSGGLPARYGRRVDVPVVAGPRLWGSASAPSGRWRPPRRARVRHAERGQAAIAGREPYRALRGPRDRVALDLGEALLDDCTP